jgi:hypothetical protein
LGFATIVRFCDDLGCDLQNQADHVVHDTQVEDPFVGSERFSAVWTNPFYASLKNKIIILNFKNIHHTEIHWQVQEKF